MRRLLFALMLWALFLPASAPAEGAARTIYVSPSGSDAYEGSQEYPLQTVEAALALYRKNPSPGGTTILLREGTYVLSEALVLTYRDRQPVTFLAYPGERPVISGESRVSGWTRVEWQGRLVWSAALNLRQIPRALYGDDGARRLAAWPKEGTLSVAYTLPTDAEDPASETQARHRAFYANPADIPIPLDGAIVRMLHLWKDELTGVSLYDPATGRVSLNRRTSMTVSPGDRYWFENVLHAPLSPGEWAYDQASGTLYYAPLPGETPEDTPLYLGALEQLLVVDGAQNIAFEGISFVRTGWSIPNRDAHVDFPQAAYDAGSCVYVANTANVAFIRCAFRDIGAGCIRFNESVKDITITGCTFENIGAHAIFVRGRNVSDPSVITERLTIVNNRIRSYGQNFRNAAAILLIHARSCEIAHNEISGGYYTAISAGWIWGKGYNVTDSLTIRNNLIFGIGQGGGLSDMGGIYLLGTQRHTVVTGNVIHGVTAADYGGWGIYLDEGASGITVTNNLVYLCSSQGFFQHKGNDNLVRNNIFAYNLEGQVGTSDKEASGTFTLEANILVSSEPFFYRKYEKEQINLKDNLFFTDESPFVDITQNDFTIRPDVDVDSVGFVPWIYDAGILTR